MITANQFEELQKHLEVFDLAINHNYIPSGQNGRVVAIEHIHRNVFDKPTDMSCGSCVFEMIKRVYGLYNEYLDHLKPLEEAKVPIVIETKQNAKRKRGR